MSLVTSHPRFKARLKVKCRDVMKKFVTFNFLLSNVIHLSRTNEVPTELTI